jgi:branched-chain amino acid transport system ATP-binding protein
VSAFLAIEDLRAGYGGSSVIRGVSLALERGHAAGVVGPNGAGKSTLLRAVSGLVRQTTGRVLLEGRDLVGMSPDHIARAGVLHVPEGRRVFSGMTVLENLRIGAIAAAGRETRAAQSQLLDTVLETFPRLRERSAQQAQTLSGGEQQMLAIGRALMGRPSLLLVDEPAMGLAPVAVRRVVDHLAAIRATWSVTVIVAEQSTAQVGRIVDDIHILANGCLQPFEAGREATSLLDTYRVENAHA